MNRTISLLSAALLLLLSCGKKEDLPKTDDRLDRPFCNDPVAINYNLDFPGYPDNSICIYPSAVFEGSYLLRDSIYFEDLSLDTANISNVLFHIEKKDKSTLEIRGFCNNAALLKLTADRYYTARLDSTFAADSSLLYAGQLYCNGTDTITGQIRLVSGPDTGRQYLRVDFTLIGDPNGIKYHRGTAIKQ